MTTTNIAIDTNILGYLHESIEISKREKAEILLSKNPKIPAQVLVEYLNFCKRSFKEKSKVEILARSLELVKNCQIIPLSDYTFTTALLLIKKYDLQLFDGIIVSSALKADCEILYTEDMQHGLKVDNKLTIVNPFL